MKLPSLAFSPEVKAQGNGVGLSALLGAFVSAALGLPVGLFLILVPIAMGLLAIVFVALDAMRANAGKAAPTPRAFFWRGVCESALAFLLNAGLAALRGAQ